MISTKNYKPLTVENIREKVDDVELFKYYIQSFKELGQPFCSELRKDNSPSCTVTKRGLKAFYRDFGTKEVMDIFQYIATKYGANIGEVLTIINNDFNLRLGTSSPKKTIPIIHSPTQIIPKQETTVIRIKKRKWDLKKDKYWVEHKLPFEHLEKEKIFPISHYWVGDLLIFREGKEVAYTYEEGNRLRKILRPYANKKRKWTSNVPSKVISGLKECKEDRPTIIAKSRKDKAVLSFLFPEYNIVSTQSETVIDTETSILLSKYSPVIVFFDNDLVGIDMATRNANLYGWKTVFMKNGYKDPSSMILEKSVEETKDYIFNLLNNEIRKT